MDVVFISSGPTTWSSRWWRLRFTLYYRFRRASREPGYTGENQWVPRREYGGWVIRPCSGWRRIRWITPPLHYTRAIPADDTYAVGTWMLEKLEM
ncbi:hypothetical protein OHB12_23700 [Nocardia sp. NBC_01730]|uniref:hypothetical protein n=1 Tax=Nocardia sp. NBC_01730 TaxID=2975998 RepID=UPI002E0EAC5A|nr:hypothetical protein OHB12_23700 [Nocardia sp. NBC_01730]